MDRSSRERKQRESWFSERISPLVSKMIEAIVIERPDNPRAWIADYMDQSRGADADPGGNAGSSGAGRADESRTGKRPPMSTTGDTPATGETTSHGEPIEADTEDPEDVPDLNALLLPSGALPLDVERFSVSYSAAVLAGWVKQGSPCCAAASLAGAWNALCGRARGAPGALNSDLVLSAMRAVVEEQVAGMVARFERLLQGSLEPLLRALGEELAAEGKHLGGKGPKSAVANGPHLLRLTRSITSRERERAGHSATFDLLWDLYEEERREAAEAAAAATAAVAAETVAEVMSAGAAAAATAWAGSSSSCAAVEKHSRGVRESEGTGGFAREDRVNARKEDGVGLRSSRAEEAESEASRKTDQVSAEGIIMADTAEAGRGKVPRRPSTGNSRVRGGRGTATASAECRPGKTLRRPQGAGDLASTGDSSGGGAWEGADGPGPARACWEKEDVEDEEEEDEDEDEEDDEDEDEEEREEQELGGGMTPAPRRRGSSSSGRKGGGSRMERARRRKSSKKAPFRRGSGGRRGGEGAFPSKWRWKKDLCALLKRMGGLDKLCMARPSTGCIGNLGLISTVRYLDGQTPGNVEVTARLFMGKGRRRPSGLLQVPLSARDDEEMIARQWAALREAFLSDRQVLLFHLTNHYALIFALREWREPPPAAAAAAACSSGTDETRKGNDAGAPGGVLRDDGRGAVGRGDDVHGSGSAQGGWTRQILTSRRGQRPTVWMDFREARKILLGWEGYKILAVQRGKEGPQLLP
eukprot:g1283.t1